MKKYIFAVVALLMGAMPAQYAHAEDGIKAGETPQQVTQRLILAVEAQRKGVIAQNLQLTAEEADAFWNVYANYRDQMVQAITLGAAVITDYADAYNNDSLSDKGALNLTNRYLSVMGKQVKIKKSFVKKFKKVLPAKKVARFYQVDHRLDQLVKMQTASGVPLVE
jgi:hypothetical protein